MCLGEYRRFPSYDGKFLVAPSDFPWAISAFAALPVVVSLCNDIDAELQRTQAVASSPWHPEE